MLLKSARNAFRKRVKHSNYHFRNGIALLSESAIKQASPTDETDVDLSSDTINELIVKCEYAVRGPLLQRAQVLEQQLKNYPGSLPFDEIVYCSIGNPHSLGQRPVSFFRDVLSLADNSRLLENSGIERVLSQTAVKRAQEIVLSIPGNSSGAYSHSQGLPLLRKQVAEGIAARDGFPSNPDNIFLTDGASSGVHYVLELLLRSGKNDGILCPIPQYPLYSAAITLHGGTLVPYYLDEGKNWSCTVAELERSLKEAQASGVHVRALCVINPGNPTGQVLDEGNQREIVKFCVSHGLVLLADEVYQDNVYSPNKKFHSFKKISCEMAVGESELLLVSFHSASKGFYGECGHRGGYMEVTGFPKEVKDLLYKVVSVNLCSNLSGQIIMGTIMKPPKEEDDAFPLFAKEREAIISSLSRKAKMLVEAFNSLEGVQCNETEGAMYVFPRLFLPAKAIEEANRLGQPADSMYASLLLEETGIVVVPGSGFGQVEGTWHVRCTILPSEEKLPSVVEKLTAFHEKFMDKYRS